MVITLSDIYSTVLHKPYTKGNNIKINPTENEEEKLVQEDLDESDPNITVDDNFTSITQKCENKNYVEKNKTSIDLPDVNIMEKFLKVPITNLKNWYPFISNDQELGFCGYNHDNKLLKIIMVQRISQNHFRDENGKIIYLEGPPVWNKAMPQSLQEEISRGIPENWQKFLQTWMDHIVNNSIGNNRKENQNCSNLNSTPNRETQNSNLNSPDINYTFDFRKPLSFNHIKSTPLENRYPNRCPKSNSSIYSDKKTLIKHIATLKELIEQEERKLEILEQSESNFDNYDGDVSEVFSEACPPKTQKLNSYYQNSSKRNLGTKNVIGSTQRINFRPRKYSKQNMFDSCDSENESPPNFKKSKNGYKNKIDSKNGTMGTRNHILGSRDNVGAKDDIFGAKDSYGEKVRNGTLGSRNGPINGTQNHISGSRDNFGSQNDVFGLKDSYGGKIRNGTLGSRNGPMCSINGAMATQNNGTLGSQNHILGSRDNLQAQNDIFNVKDYGENIRNGTLGSKNGPMGSINATMGTQNHNLSSRDNLGPQNVVFGSKDSYGEKIRNGTLGTKNGPLGHISSNFVAKNDTFGSNTGRTNPNSENISKFAPNFEKFDSKSHPLRELQQESNFAIPHPKESEKSVFLSKNKDFGSNMDPNVPSTQNSHYRKKQMKYLKKTHQNFQSSSSDSDLDLSKIPKKRQNYSISRKSYKSYRTQLEPNLREQILTSEVRLSKNQITEGQVYQNRVPEAPNNQNRIPEAQMTQNRVPEAQMTQNRISEAQIIQNRISRDQRTENWVQEVQMNQNQVSETQMGPNRVPEPHMSKNRVPDAQMSKNWVPKVQMTQNRILEAQNIQIETNKPAFLKIGPKVPRQIFESASGSDLDDLDLTYKQNFAPNPNLKNFQDNLNQGPNSGSKTKTPQDFVPKFCVKDPILNSKLKILQKKYLEIEPEKIALKVVSINPKMDETYNCTKTQEIESKNLKFKEIPCSPISEPSLSEIYRDYVLKNPERYKTKTDISSCQSVNKTCQNDINPQNDIDPQNNINPQIDIKCQNDIDCQCDKCRINSDSDISKTNDNQLVLMSSEPESELRARELFKMSREQFKKVIPGKVFVANENLDFSEPETDLGTISIVGHKNPKPNITRNNFAKNEMQVTQNSNFMPQVAQNSNCMSQVAQNTNFEAGESKNKSRTPKFDSFVEPQEPKSKIERANFKNPEKRVKEPKNVKANLPLENPDNIFDPSSDPKNSALGSQNTSNKKRFCPPKSPSGSEPENDITEKNSRVQKSRGTNDTFNVMQNVKNIPETMKNILSEQDSGFVNDSASSGVKNKTNPDFKNQNMSSGAKKRSQRGKNQNLDPESTGSESDEIDKKSKNKGTPNLRNRKSPGAKNVPKSQIGRTKNSVSELDSSGSETEKKSIEILKKTARGSKSQNGHSSAKKVLQKVQNVKNKNLDTEFDSSGSETHENSIAIKNKAVRGLKNQKRPSRALQVPKKSDNTNLEPEFDSTGSETDENSIENKNKAIRSLKNQIISHKRTSVAKKVPKMVKNKNLEPEFDSAGSEFDDFDKMTKNKPTPNRSVGAQKGTKNGPESSKNLSYDSEIDPTDLESENMNSKKNKVTRNFKNQNKSLGAQKSNKKDPKGFKNQNYESETDVDQEIKVPNRKTQKRPTRSAKNESKKKINEILHNESVSTVYEDTNAKHLASDRKIEMSITKMVAIQKSPQKKANQKNNTFLLNSEQDLVHSDNLMNETFKKPALPTLLKSNNNRKSNTNTRRTEAPDFSFANSSSCWGMGSDVGTSISIDQSTISNCTLNSTISRSGRTCRQPLKFWQGERIVLKKNEVVYTAPTISEDLSKTFIKKISPQKNTKRKTNSKSKDILDKDKKRYTATTTSSIGNTKNNNNGKFLKNGKPNFDCCVLLEKINFRKYKNKINKKVNKNYKKVKRNILNSSKLKLFNHRKRKTINASEYFGVPSKLINQNKNMTLKNTKRKLYSENDWINNLSDVDFNS